MKKILVTGSAGFIFHNFMRKMANTPYTFVSIDKVIAPYNRSSAIWNKNNHTFYLGDVADEKFLDNVFSLEKPDYVIHGAAESFVDDAIKGAGPFIHSNVVGTQAMVDVCLKHTVEKFLYVSCYDKETKAVTKNGLKDFNELQIGELVLTINPSTGIVEEKPIEKIIVQDYCGDMMYFKSSRADFLVTPNHRCLVSNVNHGKTFPLQWLTAEDPEMCGKYLPRGITNNSLTSIISIPDLGEVDAKSFFYICGVFIGNKYKNELFKSDGVNSDRIFFNLPKDNKTRSNLENCLTKLEIKYHKSKLDKRVYFNSSSWMNFFHTCGRLTKNKQIPEWMFNYGYDLLYQLWLGIHDSNRNDSNRNISITTTSEKLTSQLCYLGNMLGMMTKYKKLHKTSFVNKHKVVENYNVIYFSQKRNVKIPPPIKVNYNDKIWCLKVADNKNFLVSRSGKVFFSGNTDEVYGQLKPGEKGWTEDSKIDPRNPYSASKAAGELIVRAAHQTHGLNYIITRCCNNYGKFQPPRNLIPRIILSTLTNGKIPLHDQGKPIREWIYVDDHNDAIMQALIQGSNETFNIGSGFEMNLLETVNYICDMIGTGHNLVSFIGNRPGQDFRYSVDSSKIRNLGWVPQVNFETGIRTCIDWYSNNLDRYK